MRFHEPDESTESDVPWLQGIGKEVYLKGRAMPKADGLPESLDQHELRL